MRSFITQNEINKSKTIQVSNVMTCRTIHGVYLLTRPCGLCYVSKTKRELRIRISKHESNIGKKIEREKRNKERRKRCFIARHFQLTGCGIFGLPFKGVGVIMSLKRGSNKKQTSSKGSTLDVSFANCVSRWIK